MERKPAAKSYSFTSQHYAFGLSQRPGTHEMFFLDRKHNGYTGFGIRFMPGFKMEREVGREIFQRPVIKVKVENGYIKQISLLESK